MLIYGSVLGFKYTLGIVGTLNNFLGILLYLYNIVFSMVRDTLGIVGIVFYTFYKKIKIINYLSTPYIRPG